jgi:putative SOS response-associated peptidase YedK
MCGRYSLAAPNPAQLRARFPIGESIAIEPHYNVAPGQDIVSVTTDREGMPRGETLRWGLVPSWSADTKSGFKMINARAESLAERPAYQAPLERFRCLIPADGFYEWQPIAGERRKQPFHVTRKDGEPFAFAGLWSVWHRGEPDELRSCTIITTAANAAMAPVHSRMPAILQPDDEAVWLGREASVDELLELLHGLRDEQLALRPVGPAVGDVRNDGPACLLDPPPPLQATLFD